MRTLFVSAIALGLVAVFVAVTFGLDKGKLSEGFAREDTAQLSGIQVDGDLFTRQTKHIPVAGALNIEGWLYLPRQPSEKFRESIVLLGHGLGAQKDFGLEMYASMYAAEGLAAMSFDYRTFGGSDGEPRNLILPSMQVEDWKAVFAFAKSLGYSRIVLHGTSYAGGHVVTAASQLGEDNALLGVISQVPYLGGPGGKKANIERRGIGGVLQLILLWLLDLSNSVTGQPPVGLKIASSEPGDLALMNLTPKEIKQYFGKHPSTRLGGWQNFAAGRGLMDMLLYKPMRSVPDLPVPTLMVSVTDDSLCPVSDMEMARDISNGMVELYILEGGHFDVYHGEVKEKTMEKYKEFVHSLHGSSGSGSGSDDGAQQS